LFFFLQHLWLTAVDFKNINPPTMEGLGVLMAVSIGPVILIYIFRVQRNITYNCSFITEKEAFIKVE
jgi:hypothetical protein